MTAADAFRGAQEAGVEITLQGDKLLLETSSPPPEDVLDTLTRNKTAIVAFLRASKDEWSIEEWRAYYDERAGIAEFDGGLPRGEAEVLAHACCVSEWLNCNPGRSSPLQCLGCGKGEISDDPLLPFGTEITGHVWLHHRCWDAWHRGRKLEAAAALSAMGIKIRNSET